MIKTTKTKTYNTETAELIKKVTFGTYGDPAGYEMTMYRTAEGDYFLYTYGGENSAYPTEAIKAFSKAAAKKWLEEN